jgi:hypothetical protein
MFATQYDTIKLKVWSYMRNVLICNLCSVPILIFTKKDHREIVKFNYPYYLSAPLQYVTDKRSWCQYQRQSQVCSLQNTMQRSSTAGRECELFSFVILQRAAHSHFYKKVRREMFNFTYPFLYAPLKDVKDDLKLKTSFINMVLHFQPLDTNEKLLEGTSSSKGQH